MRVALAGLASAPLPGAAPRRGTFVLSRRAAALTLLLTVGVAGIGDTFRGPGGDRGAPSPGRSGSGSNPGDADALTPGHGAGDLPISGPGTLRVPDAAGAFEIAGAAGQPVAPGHSTAIDLRLVNPHRHALT